MESCAGEGDHKGVYGENGATVAFTRQRRSLLGCDCLRNVGGGKHFQWAMSDGHIGSILLAFDRHGVFDSKLDRAFVGGKTCALRTHVPPPNRRQILGDTVIRSWLVYRGLVATSVAQRRNTYKSRHLGQVELQLGISVVGNKLSEIVTVFSEQCCNSVVLRISLQATASTLVGRLLALLTACSRSARLCPSF